MRGLLLSDIISVEVTIVLCENRGGMRFMHDLMSVLQSVSVLNRDNGFSFTNTERLDATEEGWVTEADFTIENDFWDEEFGEEVVKVVRQSGYNWNYVPGEPDEIPGYIPKQRIINVEAYADESWDYDEADIPCFSFCLPTKGEMHCNDGILARKSSFMHYTEVLERLLTNLCHYY